MGQTVGVSFDVQQTGPKPGRVYVLEHGQAAGAEGHPVPPSFAWPDKCVLSAFYAFGLWTVSWDYVYELEPAELAGVMADVPRVRERRSPLAERPIHCFN